MQLTLQQLNKISPAIVGVRGKNIVDSINEIFPLYNGMENRLVLCATIANMLHESAEFSRFEENLNYSVEGLLKTFSRSRITLDQCKAYGRVDGMKPANKRAIANTVYGGTWGRMHLGNTQYNDGYELRGSGVLQATGRLVFMQFTAYYNNLTCNKFTVFEMANQLRDVANLKINMHFVCWFIVKFKKITEHAGNFVNFCIAINGGMKGYDERLKYYNLGIKNI